MSSAKRCRFESQQIFSTCICSRIFICEHLTTNTLFGKFLPFFRQVAERRISEENQMFDLDQRTKQQQTMVNFARQDKEALDEKVWTRAIVDKRNPPSRVFSIINNSNLTSPNPAKRSMSQFQLKYFNSRLADKLEEVLNLRKAKSSRENRLVFLDKEVSLTSCN